MPPKLTHTQNGADETIPYEYSTLFPQWLVGSVDQQYDRRPHHSGKHNGQDGAGGGQRQVAVGLRVRDLC